MLIVGTHRPGLPAQADLQRLDKHVQEAAQQEGQTQKRRPVEHDSLVPPHKLQQRDHGVRALGGPGRASGKGVDSRLPAPGCSCHGPGLLSPLSLALTSITSPAPPTLQPWNEQWTWSLAALD